MRVAPGQLSGSKLAAMDPSRFFALSAFQRSRGSISRLKGQVWRRSRRMAVFVSCELQRMFLKFCKYSSSVSLNPMLWDNAPMESFSHTLKTERVYHRVYATRDEARRDLFGYIEGFYNPRRVHSALGYISPAEAKRRAA
jgi:hypothetical protein